MSDRSVGGSGNITHQLSQGVHDTLKNAKELTQSAFKLIEPSDFSENSNQTASSPPNAPSSNFISNFTDRTLEGAENLLATADLAINRSINEAAGQLNAFWQGDAAVALKNKGLPSSSSNDPSISPQSKSIPVISSDDSELAAEAQVASLFGLVALALFSIRPHISGMRILLANRPGARARRLDEFKESLLGPVRELGGFPEEVLSFHMIKVLEPLQGVLDTLGFQTVFDLVYPELNTLSAKLDLGPLEVESKTETTTLIRQLIRINAKKRGLFLTEEEVSDIFDEIKFHINPKRRQLLFLAAPIAVQLMRYGVDAENVEYIDMGLKSLLMSSRIDSTFNGETHEGSPVTLTYHLFHPEEPQSAEYLSDVLGDVYTPENMRMLQGRARALMIAQLKTGETQIDEIRLALTPETNKSLFIYNLVRLDSGKGLKELQASLGFDDVQFAALQANARKVRDQLAEMFRVGDYDQLIIHEIAWQLGFKAITFPGDDAERQAGFQPEISLVEFLDILGLNDHIIGVVDFFTALNEGRMPSDHGLWAPMLNHHLRQVDLSSLTNFIADWSGNNPKISQIYELLSESYDAFIAYIESYAQSDYLGDLSDPSDRIVLKAALISVLREYQDTPFAYELEDAARESRLVQMLTVYNLSPSPELAETIIEHCTLMRLGNREDAEAFAAMKAEVLETFAHAVDEHFEIILSGLPEDRSVGINPAAMDILRSSARAALAKQNIASAQLATRSPNSLNLTRQRLRVLR